MSRKKVVTETSYEKDLKTRATVAMVDIMSGYVSVMEYLASLKNEVPPLQGTEREGIFSEVVKGLYPEAATNGLLRAYLFSHHIFKAWEIFSGEEGTPPPTLEELRAQLEVRRAEKRARAQQ